MTPQTLALLDELEKEVGAYRRSFAVLAAVELGLLDALSQAPQSAAALAAAQGLGARRLQALLDLLVAYGYLSEQAGLYAPAPAYREAFSPETQGNAQSRLAHIARIAPSWARLSEVLRQDTPVRELPFGKRRDQTDIDAFHLTLGLRTEALLRELAPQLALKPGARLLDLGGGFGALLKPLLERDPNARGVLFDSPDTVARARLANAEAPWARALSYLGGDFLNDPLPGEMDFIALSSILHIFDPPTCRALIARAARALAPGGQLFIRENTLAPSRQAPIAGAEFSLHMAIQTQGGRAYPQEEIVLWLQDAGCVRVRTLSCTPQITILLAAKEEG